MPLKRKQTPPLLCQRALALISIARMQAAVLNQEPEFPRWVAELDGDWEENASQSNAWIYETYHEKPWLEQLLAALHEHVREGI